MSYIFIFSLRKQNNPRRWTQVKAVNHSFYTKYTVHTFIRRKNELKALYKKCVEATHIYFLYYKHCKVFPNYGSPIGYCQNGEYPMHFKSSFPYFSLGVYKYHKELYSIIKTQNQIHCKQVYSEDVQLVVYTEVIFTCCSIVQRYTRMATKNHIKS